MSFLDNVIQKINGKKCIVYGAGTGSKVAINHLLKKNITIAYAVDINWENCEICLPDFPDIMIDIKSPYDLLYEQRGEIFVLVCVSAVYMTEVEEVLLSMGFLKGQDYAHWGELVNGGLERCFDPFLGYARLGGGGNPSMDLMFMEI